MLLVVLDRLVRVVVLFVLVLEFSSFVWAACIVYVTPVMHEVDMMTNIIDGKLAYD